MVGRGELGEEGEGEEEEKRPEGGEGAPEDGKVPGGVADMIGEFGAYQLSLSALAFVRYVCVAMMTNSGPLIAPEVEFSCWPPDELLGWLNIGTSNSSAEYLRQRCQLELLNGTSFRCNRWRFDRAKFGLTLTDTFELVCSRDWLRSLLQSTISVGVVVASVLWGTVSDRYGRLQAARTCYAIALAAGLTSYLADHFFVYALARATCSMADVGLVVSLTIIIVETLGAKFRGAVCITVYTGWAMGVMVMPWLTSHFRDFRRLMLFTVACHLLTLPWLLTVGESIRWLSVHLRLDKAQAELRRVSNINLILASRRHQIIDQTMKKFDQFKVKYELMARRNSLEAALEQQQVDKMATAKNTSPGPLVASIRAGCSQIGQLFRSRELATTTLTITWTTFNSELLYMLFIMINSDIGDDVKFNYFVGGLMEVLATLLSIVMISSLTRKFSLASTLLTISALCLTLSAVHSKPTWSVWTLNLTKLAISTLSSLIFAVTTEMFPTNLRQTGIGLASTLGSLGAVIAPFIRTELADRIGMTNVMLILFMLPLTAALVIPFCLRETRGLELPDDVDDMGAGQPATSGGQVGCNPLAAEMQRRA